MPAWQSLAAHQQQLAEMHMRDLFAADPERFQRFSLFLDDILFDYSKNRVTRQTMALLFDLARQANLERDAFGFGMMLGNLQALLAGEPLPFPGGF